MGFNSGFKGLSWESQQLGIETLSRKKCGILEAEISYPILRVIESLAYNAIQEAVTAGTVYAT